MSLQRQYRPPTLKMYAGNSDTKKNIEKMMARDNPPDAILIVGPPGCGKTTLGRIIARMLKCHKDDFKEMNTANDRSIKSIRKVIDDMKYTPMSGPKKVIMLDEAHQLLAPPQNALLKALEEPPAHVHWILCTTNPESLLSTLKRRCHIYEVKLLTSAEIVNHAKKILKAEKVENYPEEIMDKIIELSGGSLGIALKNLDMVIDMGDDIEGALNTLKTAGTSEADVMEINRALVNFNMSDSARWARIKKLLTEFNGDGESARRPILGYLRKCLLNSKMDNNGDAIALMMESFKDNFYDSGKSGLALACYTACHLDGE